VFVVTDDERAAERFRSIAGIRSVDRDGSVIAIRGAGGDLVTHVVECLAEHRIRVIDLRTELPTLEDVFLRLTGHTIRD
jgi:ABC-2 type transport system ATP-binding protein